MLETCPDELILFFHHVPYTYALHSGKTVIQSIYDSHYAGAAAAADYVKQWHSIRGLVDDRRYAETLDQLEYQSGHAIVWRDAICQYFLKLSGIPDDLGRAGVYPNRVEAETMTLEGYTVVDIKPWECASRGQAIAVTNAAGKGAATHIYQGRRRPLQRGRAVFRSKQRRRPFPLGRERHHPRANGSPAAGSPARCSMETLPAAEPSRTSRCAPETS